MMGLLKETEKKLESFEQALRVKGMGFGTVRFYDETLYEFFKMFPGIRPEDVACSDVLRFIRSQLSSGKSWKWIDGQLRRLRDFYEFLEVASPTTGLRAKDVALGLLPESTLLADPDFELG